AREARADDLGVRLDAAMPWLFALVFVCFALTWGLFKWAPRATRLAQEVILAALGLLLLLAVTAIVRTFLVLAPSLEGWGHLMATVVFLPVLLIYVGPALASLSHRAEAVLLYYLTSPVIALSLVVHIAVVADNTIRFHFSPFAYFLAWVAIFGLGVLANSYEPRR